MNIGQGIKDIRKSKNLSQGDLAKKIGLSQTSLSQIELGLKKPSSSTLEKICAVFEMPEMLLYIMSATDEDVPEKKRELYKLLFPTIKSMILQIVQD